MLRKLLKNKEGFTLIELMIVIAIIGILAAIAIPQFSKYKQRAAKASAISDAKNLASSIEAYYSDYDTYPSTLTPGHTVILGSDTFTLSKNNYLVGYATLDNGRGYSFSITNSQYDVTVVYDSTQGGLIKK